MTNNEEWEDRASEISRLSGDLCFPLVFSPELHFEQFKSEVADMTNSVTVRIRFLIETKRKLSIMI